MRNKVYYIFLLLAFMAESHTNQLEPEQEILQLWTEEIKFDGESFVINLQKLEKREAEIWEKIQKKCKGGYSEFVLVDGQLEEIKIKEQSRNDKNDCMRSLKDLKLKVVDRKYDYRLRFLQKNFENQKLNLEQAKINHIEKINQVYSQYK